MQHSGANLSLAHTPANTQHTGHWDLSQAYPASTCMPGNSPTSPHQRLFSIESHLQTRLVTDSACRFVGEVATAWAGTRHGLRLRGAPRRNVTLEKPCEARMQELPATSHGTIRPQVQKSHPMRAVAWLRPPPAPRRAARRGHAGAALQSCAAARPGRRPRSRGLLPVPAWPGSLGPWVAPDPALPPALADAAPCGRRACTARAPRSARSRPRQARGPAALH